MFNDLFIGNENDLIPAGIERGCYKKAMASTTDSNYLWSVYSDICYRVYYNLAETTVNPDIWEGLIDGTIDPASIAEMTTEQLNPTVNQAIRDNIERRRQQRLERAVSNLYTCPKCHKKDTEYCSYQSASADEGSTLMIKCLTPDCLHTWKQR
jgi:DNA-directed RNA polymerase subunit M/transcription elongation factor TFIIS